MFLFFWLGCWLRVIDSMLISLLYSSLTAINGKYRIHAQMQRIYFYIDWCEGIWSMLSTFYCSIVIILFSDSSSFTFFFLVLFQYYCRHCTIYKPFTFNGIQLYIILWHSSTRVFIFIIKTKCVRLLRTAYVCRQRTTSSQSLNSLGAN